MSTSPDPSRKGAVTEKMAGLSSTPRATGSPINLRQGKQPGDEEHFFFFFSTPCFLLFGIRP